MQVRIGDSITIIAFDMMIAVPLSLALAAILIGSVYANQAESVGYASSSYNTIRDYGISQQIIEIVSPSYQNYSSSMHAAFNLSMYYNVTVNFTSTDNYSYCQYHFCRIVEIGGIAELMVIR